MTGPDEPVLVPVTVLGGYLGAGKTTLINRLLAGDHGERLAILVNDFGAINVDAALIKSHDGTTISLENGCVCCSIADAMGDALDAVLATSPDQIIIEASGVADPGKVATYGQGWPGCRLASVIVLADASAIQRQADDRFVGQLIRTQLRSADVVQLTKTDLIEADQVAAVRGWLDTDAWVTEADCGPTSRTGPVAAALFDSTTVQLDPQMTHPELAIMLDALAPSVVRAKGIVLVDGSPHVVQLAGERWTIEPADPAAKLTGLVQIAVNRQFSLRAP